MQIQRQIQIQNRGDSVVQVRTILLVSDFGSSTRGERHNSYYANPIPTRGASQFIFAGRDTKSSTAATTVENSTLYPNGREINYLPTWSNVNFQLTLFQNPQILRTISSGYDIIHTLAPFPVWGLS